MTERGLPIVDGPVACPFVAFDEDRDERATGPDHRHRCYAEVPPAPRAFAHQEAYCLSSAFPVCPTFQDWARREAARARDAAPPRERPARRGTSREPEPVVLAGDPEDARPGAYSPDSGDDELDEPLYEDPRPRRNPQRGWASPPPWLSRADAGDPDDADEGEEDELDDRGGGAAGGLAQGGLAGSIADRLASSTGAAPRQPGPVEPPRGPQGRGAPPSREQAWRAGDRWDDEGGLVAESEDWRADEPPARPPRRRQPEPEPEPESPGPTRHRERVQAAAPAWERPARLEAYPTLRSRRLSGITLPPILVGLLAILLAAVILFLLPGFLGIGSQKPGTSAAPTGLASVSPVESLAPTEVPAATQQVYIVQAGDTMSRIANKFHVPLQTLIDANKTNIPDPNRLSIGQAVFIPATTPGSLPGASSAPSPSP